jgi:peptidoglycan/xylan/chitin deacetylase (PgdA/CDA1 family)
MLIAVNYHYIRQRFDTSYPSIFGVTPKEFSEQLDLLGKTARFLSTDNIVDIIDGRNDLPARSVVITFDDGLREQYDLAWPILQKKGIPAIFFINTKPIQETSITATHKIHIIRAYTPPDRVLTILSRIMEKENITFDLPSESKARAVYKYDTPEAARLKYFLNHVLNEEQKELVIDNCFKMLGFDETTLSAELYMTKDMALELGRVGAVGTHGHAHRPLGLLKDNEAISDFDMSVTLLKEWIGCNVKAFSYPFGFYEACSKIVAVHAQSCHIKFAFTMERSGNKNLDTPMFLGRFYPNDTFKSDNSGLLDGFWEGLDHTAWFS